MVVCGHTHVQFDRQVAGKRLVNAGSVGMPYEAQPGAYWALLGPDVELRRTAYDLEAAAAAIRATGFPGAEELAAENVLTVPSAEEATEQFERLAAGPGTAVLVRSAKLATVSMCGVCGNMSTGRTRSRR